MNKPTRSTPKNKSSDFKVGRPWQHRKNGQKYHWQTDCDFINAALVSIACDVFLMKRGLPTETTHAGIITRVL